MPLFLSGKKLQPEIQKHGKRSDFSVDLHFFIVKRFLASLHLIVMRLELDIS